MKGILFKPWKIKAITDSPLDREWMTRRVIKPQPELTVSDEIFKHNIRVAPHLFKSRYQPGETVYIKEAFTYVTLAEKDPWKDRAIKDGSFRRKPDDSPVTVWYKLGGYEIAADWENPRTMPAWAARYHILITDVGAERLQQISLADIYAEGCPLEAATIFTDPMTGYEHQALAYEWYHDLWDSINKPPYDWQSNPWVFVYSFKRAEGK